MYYLKLFLIFSDIEPQYSYKLYSYILELTIDYETNLTRSIARKDRKYQDLTPPSDLHSKEDIHHHNQVNLLYLLPKRTRLAKFRLISSLAFCYNYLFLFFIVLCKPQVAICKLPEYSEAYICM